MSESGEGAVVAAESRGAEAPFAAEVAKAATRVALGWFLFHQGWRKVTEEWTGGPGSFYRSDAFQGRNPKWLPDLVAAPYAYALPWVELVFGALLIAGAFSRVTAAVATLVLLSIAVAMLDSGGLLPRHMLMVYVPLALWFTLTGAGRYSLDAFMAVWRDGARAPADGGGAERRGPRAAEPARERIS